MAAARDRARVFGEVAEAYDRVRPGYPAALVDDVLAYARLGDGDALEVGAGTGKATLAFAEQGVPITALEPDEAMANVLARRVNGRTNVSVKVCPFERYSPRRSFGLVFSAQAWHWTDPASRWQRVAAALAPGGALALFWNIDEPANAEVLAAIVAAHRAHAPAVDVHTEPISEASLATVWPRTELEALTEFAEVSIRLYHRALTLSTMDYLTYLSTQSAYRLLDDDARAALFEAIGTLLGDHIELSVATALYLARRRPAR